MKKQGGNTLIIFSIFFAIFLTILLFVSAIFMSHVNNILYNFKLDMYSIARSGIIAVNKNTSNAVRFTYDTKAFKKEFEDGLKMNYELNDDFSNPDKLISKIKIKEYKIYNKGNKDSYTNQKCKSRILHIVLDVEIRPIILKDYFKKFFVFEIHEDVDLNMVYV